MLEELRKRLLQFLLEDHLDIAVPLMERGELDKYLDNKMASIESYYDELLEEVRNRKLQPTEMKSLCWKNLVEDLLVSRYHYIKNIIETEYPDAFKVIRENGMVTATTISVVDSCQAVFETYDFNVENEHNPALRQAIINQIKTSGLL